MTTILVQLRTFCPDDADRLLDWMAHMLQYPTVKPQKGMVLLGPPGCGKTLFATLLTLLLGRGRVWQTTTLKHLNGEVEGVTLVHLTECDLREELPRIHTFISDQIITIQQPYQEPHTIPSQHRVLITTNSLPPLHANAFQQRFTVIPCGSAAFNPHTFHANIHEPIKVQELRQYLMQRHVNANGLDP